jgi:hypothetical protein
MPSVRSGAMSLGGAHGRVTLALCAYCWVTSKRCHTMQPERLRCYCKRCYASLGSNRCPAHPTRDAESS